MGFVRQVLNVGICTGCGFFIMSLKKHFVRVVADSAKIESRKKVRTGNSDVFKFRYSRLSWQFSGM